MTFVTAEPYIGHLGLGGVGDTKGLLEHEMRQRSIRWITNAKVDQRRGRQDERDASSTRTAKSARSTRWPSSTP